jgi:hypothetical protein
MVGERSEEGFSALTLESIDRCSLMSVVIGRNLRGEIVFIRKDEDGTLVVLTCEDLDSLDELAGSVIVPRRIEDEEGDDQPQEEGSFPVGLLDTHQSAADTALTIDISDLPRGLLLFEPAKLARSALALLQSGETEVRLDPSSAVDFGFTKALGRRSAMEPGA